MNVENEVKVLMKRIESMGSKAEKVTFFYIEQYILPLINVLNEKVDKLSKHIIE